MTVEDEILKELREQNRFIKAQLVVLTEIKFELQNSRVMSETSYKIKVKKSWLDLIKGMLKKF